MQMLCIDFFIHLFYIKLELGHITDCKKQPRLAVNVSLNLRLKTKQNCKPPSRLQSSPAGVCLNARW